MLEMGTQSMGMEWKGNSINMYMHGGMMRVMVKVF